MGLNSIEESAGKKKFFISFIKVDTYKILKTLAAPTTVTTKTYKAVERIFQAAGEYHR